MSIEEAIKAFDLLGHAESIVATYNPGEKRNDTTLWRLKEAGRMAVDALRAQQTTLDRTRWHGCHICNNTHGLSGEILMHGVGYARLGEFECCPNCVRPLTEQAWAELERRVNGGTDDR